MSPLSLFYLHSQLELCERLMQQANKGDTFIFLSGEAGSGRSTMLELTATGLERKMRSVYLPCIRETTLASLTEILSSQLLPPDALNQGLPLGDVLNKISADSKNKLLILVDDIDLAPAECFQALTEICKKFAGSKGCALLCSGSTEWVKKNASAMTGRIKNISVKQYAVTPLDDEEGMEICQLVFKNKQNLPLFTQFKSKIKSGLSACGGNISKIIAYAERMNNELISPDISRQAAAAAGAAVAVAAAAGSSAAAASVSVNPPAIKSVDEEQAGTNTPEEVPAPGLMEGAYIPESTMAEQVGDPGIEPPHAADPVADVDPAAVKTAKEPEGEKKRGSMFFNICILIILLLAAAYAGKTYFEGKSEQSRSSQAQQTTQRNTASEPVVDEGALNEAVPEGPAVQSPPLSTQQSITLSGEELQQIEDGALPPPKVQRLDPNAAPALENGRNSQPQEAAGRPDTAEGRPAPARPAPGGRDQSWLDVPADGSTAVSANSWNPGAAARRAEASSFTTAAQREAAAGRQEGEDAAARRNALTAPAQPARLNAADGRGDEAAASSLNSRPATGGAASNMGRSTERPAAQPPRPAPIAPAAPAAAAPAAATPAAGSTASGSGLRDDQVTIPARPTPTPAPAASSTKQTAPAAGSASSAQKRTAAPVRAGTLRPENVTPSGQAVPGGTAELATKNDRSYTVQIVASRNRDALVRVAAALMDRYWIYETSRERRPWYVLITGDYPNSAAAQNAISRLPGVLKTARPFVKSFGTVKQEIARAQ